MPWIPTGYSPDELPFLRVGVGYVSIAWHVCVRSVVAPLHDLCISMETRHLQEAARRLCVQRILALDHEHVRLWYHRAHCCGPAAGPHAIMSLTRTSVSL